MLDFLLESCDPTPGLHRGKLRVRIFQRAFSKILFGGNEKREKNFPGETLSWELLKFVLEDIYICTKSFEQSEENKFLH